MFIYSTQTIPYQSRYIPFWHLIRFFLEYVITVKNPHVIISSIWFWWNLSRPLFCCFGWFPALHIRATPPHWRTPPPRSEPMRPGVGLIDRLYPLCLYICSISTYKYIYIYKLSLYMLYLYTVYVIYLYMYWNRSYLSIC